LRLVFVEARKKVAPSSVGRAQEPGPDRQTRNCGVLMYWQSSYGLPTLDCNLYSQAYSLIGTNPEHPMPFSITCAARSCQKSRDPGPSTEHVRDRIASVGRLFGNRRRTEWRSVRAVACSDVGDAPRRAAAPPPPPSTACGRPWPARGGPRGAGERRRARAAHGVPHQWCCHRCDRTTGAVPSCTTRRVAGHLAVQRT